MHRDVCRALGLPKSFEFQLKDEGGFVFYPSKRQMQPRAHQHKLVVGSFVSPAECWARPDQAISDTYIEQLMKTLDCHHCYFSGTEDPGFGCLVLSKVNFSDVRTEKLRGTAGRQWSTRVAQCVQLNTKIPFLIVNTHLDHLSEQERLIQLRQLLKAFPAASKTVLCGDFNALCKFDYTDEQISFIREQRHSNRLEEPKFDVVSLLQEKLADAAWCGPHPARQGCVDPTTRYGTRVDYIFVSNDLRQALTYYCVTPYQATDHHAIVVEVQPWIAQELARGK